MIASALGAILILAAIAGFSHSFSTLQLDRENSRAIQILVEKTEMLRTYNWDQITGNDTSASVPSSFTAPFYPNDTNNGGFTYSGSVSIKKAKSGTTYDDDMRLVTITLNWTSGNAARSRSMMTYVSHYGLQNYIY